MSVCTCGTGPLPCPMHGAPDPCRLADDEINRLRSRLAKAERQRDKALLQPGQGYRVMCEAEHVLREAVERERDEALSMRDAALSERSGLRERLAEAERDRDRARADCAALENARTRGIEDVIEWTRRATEHKRERDEARQDCRTALASRDEWRAACEAAGRQRDEALARLARRVPVDLPEDPADDDPAEIALDIAAAYFNAEDSIIRARAEQGLPEARISRALRAVAHPARVADAVNVSQIVAGYLRDHGYDGLWREGSDCCCDAPCSSMSLDCRPGRRYPCRCDRDVLLRSVGMLNVSHDYRIGDVDVCPFCSGERVLCRICHRPIAVGFPVRPGECGREMSGGQHDLYMDCYSSAREYWSARRESK